MTTTQPFDNHLLALWADQNLETPAFVYDEAAILENLTLLSVITQHTACRLLYSIKALSYPAVLDTIRPHVSGYSTSSLFECRLAREMADPGMTIHITSPGIRTQDMGDISHYCNYISFNSLSQWQQFRGWTTGMHAGLRINPGLSFARDLRYDPCRPHSKLGVSLARIPPEDDPVWKNELSGLHIHSNCESDNFNELIETVEHVASQRPGLLERLDWLNLGGGYLLSSREQLTDFSRALRRISSQFGLQLYFEPGKAIVGNAGYVVASVIDLFESGNRKVAVLDTTVNHLPEVFEYQYRPAILQENRRGQYSYRLAGASCLSGDLFGDYRFERPLETGNRIIFSKVGAYMMVKANMFNGINLPAVYAVDREGKLALQKRYDYDDYHRRLV